MTGKKKEDEVPARGKVLVYKNRVEVLLEKDTVWLTQKQMADLFDTERSVVTKHVRNIYNTKELDRKTVCAKFAHTAEDGKVYQTQFYNLDAIISVGYRVNSKRGTQFRIWATNVLKKHLVDGYTINEKCLRASEHKYQQLKQSLKLLSNVVHIEDVSDEAKGLIEVITQYSHALDVLDDYDHERLSVPKGIKRLKFKLTYEKARKIIDALRKKFKGSALVGREKDKSFQGSLGAIYQTFDGRDVYPTVEEKAAHLLYFVTKNHSFVDGNKRIAAALFICFLDRNGILYRKDRSQRIDNNALVALTLMIAVSKPLEKEMMIKIILNLLV
jgi:prophage maintenance system killer protein